MKSVVGYLKGFLLLSSLFPGGLCLLDSSNPFHRTRRSGEVPVFLPGLSVRRNPIDAELRLTSGGAGSHLLIDQETNDSSGGLFKPSEKRSTLLLDKILFALQRAVNDKKLGGLGSSSSGGGGGGPDLEEGLKKASALLREELLDRKESPTIGNRALRVSEPINFSAYTGNGLQRRGTSNGKVYWRCYFNAVSCF